MFNKKITCLKRKGKKTHHHICRIKFVEYSMAVPPPAIAGHSPAVLLLYNSPPLSLSTKNSSTSNRLHPPPLATCYTFAGVAHCLQGRGAPVTFLLLFLCTQLLQGRSCIVSSTAGTSCFLLFVSLPYCHACSTHVLHATICQVVSCTC